MPPPGPVLPHAYSRPESHTSLFVVFFVFPNDADGEPDGDAAVDATAAPDAAPAEGTADDDADTSSSTAPDDPAVVDEHPATATDTTATPTASTLRRTLIAYPDPQKTKAPLAPLRIRRTILPHGSHEPQGNPSHPGIGRLAHRTQTPSSDTRPAHRRPATCLPARPRGIKSHGRPCLNENATSGLIRTANHGEPRLKARTG